MRRKRSGGLVSRIRAWTWGGEPLTLHVYVAEEAQKSVSGMTETAIHAKYIELVRVLLLEICGESERITSPSRPSSQSSSVWNETMRRRSRSW